MTTTQEHPEHESGAQPLGLARLREMMLEPNWADADPDARRVIVLDLPELARGNAQERAHLARWIASQSIPVVGFGDSVGALVESVDVVTADAQQLAHLVAQIERYPRAAAISLQVLRASLNLDPLSALAMESLGYATLQGGAEYAAWLAERSPVTPKVPSGDVVELSRTADRLGVTLNHVANRNALSVAMRDGLSAAFKLASLDTSIVRIEVTGRGPCFCAGGDLSEFAAVPDVSRSHDIRSLRMPARYLLGCAERAHFHLHGASVGAGIELAAFAGRLTAAPDATFRLPELAMGLLPGAGGCVSLPRRIGRQRTAQLLLSGVELDAQQALRWGLIDAISDRPFVD